MAQSDIANVVVSYLGSFARDESYLVNGAVVGHRQRRKLTEQHPVSDHAGDRQKRDPANPGYQRSKDCLNRGEVWSQTDQTTGQRERKPRTLTEWVKLSRLRTTRFPLHR